MGDTAIGPFTPAVELAAAVRSKEVSPVELADPYLDRIDRLDPQLHAFCHRADDDVRAAAKVAADAVVAAGSDVDALPGRLDPHPGVVLRPRRPQAHAGAHPRREGRARGARHRRGAGPHGGRRRRCVRLPGGPRPRRVVLAAGACGRLRRRDRSTAARWPAGMDTDAMMGLFNCAPMAVFTSIFNVTGLPAISVPAHVDEATGLPVGVQIVAAPWREDLLLQVAAHLEQAFGWQDRRPATA